MTPGSLQVSSLTLSPQRQGARKVPTPAEPIPRDKRDQQPLQRNWEGLFCCRYTSNH